MKQKNRQEIENLLLQVTEMLGKIQNRKDDFAKNTSLEMLNQLNHLEKAIEFFNLINQEDLKAANIDLEQLKADSVKNNSISEKDKELLKRAQEVEKEAHQIKNQLFENSKKENKKNQKSPAQKTARDRRNRFKPLGGNKNWIHL